MRVTSQMEPTGKFTLGDCECAECHAEFVGDLLGWQRSPAAGRWPKAAAARPLSA